MYYLLGYRLFGEQQETKQNCELPPDDTASSSEYSEEVKKTKPKKAKESDIHKNSPLKKAHETFGYFVKSEMLKNRDEKEIAKVT